MKQTIALFLYQEIISGMRIPKPSISCRMVVLLFLFTTFTLFIDDIVLAQSKIRDIHQIPITSALTFPEDTKIRFENNQGTITFLRAKNLSKNLETDPDFRVLLVEDDPAKIALAFIRAYKKQFGLFDPDNELVIKSVNQDELGYKQIRFRQVYLKIPVWNAEILAQLDSENHVTLMNGQYCKTPVGIKTQPGLNRQHVFEIVTNLFEIDQACKDCKLRTIIYAPQNKDPRLAFQVSVTISLIEGWEVIIDAHTGSILSKVSTVYSGALKGQRDENNEY